MKSFNYIITDKIGLHARPAGLIVKIAKPFTSNITIQENGRSADAKKIMTILALGVRTGVEVTVTADGEDENEAIVILEELFKENI